MIKQPAKLAKIATLASLTFLVGIGLVMAVFEVRPFWVDEWRIIYNLKTKGHAALWGPLDFMQQFPRVYLQAMKGITSAFGYSYSSLRLPSFLVGTAALAFCYRLMLKIYPNGNAVRFLFVLILASSHTFVAYFVQCKQYTMDIFLSLVALWQLLQLLQLKVQNGKPLWRYCLLCITFVVSPFFSYSYPILAVPILAIAILQTAAYKPMAAGGPAKSTFVIKLWLPLLLCLVSMGVFYTLDAAQLMKDNGMKSFWESMMMRNGFSLPHFLQSFYLIFANVGSGLLFGLIFGITGIAAFALAISNYIGNYRVAMHDTGAQLRLYAVLLIGTILLLFVAGRLPIGEPRLNSYSVAAIAILIIYLLETVLKSPKAAKAVVALTVILFLGTIGNIINSPVKSLMSSEHRKTLAIYRVLTAAIQTAQAKGLPLLVTSAAGYPDEKVINFPLSSIRAGVLCFPPGYEASLHFNAPDDMPADWVLKTLPAYKMGGSPVYAIDNINNASGYLAKIPGNYALAVAVNDTCYKIVARLAH